MHKRTTGDSARPIHELLDLNQKGWTRAPNRILDSPQIPPLPKLVLLHIIRHDMRGRGSFASQITLAKKLAVGRAAVGRALAWLTKARLITKDDQMVGRAAIYMVLR